MTSTLKERIRWTFNDRVTNILTRKGIDQANGEWRTEDVVHGHRCCFAARAHKALSKLALSRYTYQEGMNLLCKELELTLLQVCFLLWVCGADDQPFGASPWPFMVEQVLSHMKAIEWVPSQETLLSSDFAVDGEYAFVDREPFYELLCAPATTLIVERVHDMLHGQY